jgi:hypothetical protein
MSTLTKSLGKRIHELRLSIESQKAELAAYEKVLEIELANPGESHQMGAPESANTEEGNPHPAKPQFPTDEPAVTETRIAASATTADPEFSGSKADFVTAIVKARGTSGVTPKDVDKVFATRRIARSKNLIYSALSSLVKQRKAERKEGRYFFLSGDSSEKVVAPKKRRISAAGLKRIREANKKRWARDRATRGARAKSAPKKSVRGASKVRTKRAPNKTAA